MSFESTGSTFNLSENQLLSLKAEAEHGGDEAAFKLYQYYSFSKFEPATSLSWLKKSSELGWGKAQHHLAFYYFREKDFEQADFWATREIFSGEEKAKRYLKSG